MKISLRNILIVLSTILSLFSFYGVTYQVSDGLFVISHIEPIFDESGYYLDLDVQKEVDEEITFDVEVINKEENLVIGTKKFSCDSTTCSQKISLGRTIFGEHEISIITKYQRYFYKQKKKFFLEEQKNEKYTLSLPNKIEITENSFNAVFKGSITTKESSEFFIEVFPKSIPDEKVSFSLMCDTNCKFEQNISQPLILGEYQVNVYTQLGESLHTFTLGYFENDGVNTGNIENDNTELETSLEFNIGKEFIEKKERTLDTKLLFDESLEKEKDEQTKKVVTKIELDGTQSKIEINKNSKIILREEDSFVLIDEELGTRTQNKASLKSVEVNELISNNKLKNSTYTNLNTQEVVLFTNTSSSIPGIYKEEFENGSKNYFALGLISINTQKSLYEKDTIAKFIIVVLDSKGFLQSSSNISLTITKPDGTLEYLSSKLRSIIESKKNGVYFGFMNTSQIGEYTLLVSTQVDGYSLTRESYINTVDILEYEILRSVPATIDPFLGPFKNEFYLSTLIENQSVELSEKLPLSFEIVDTNADRIEKDNISNIQYLFWENVTSFSNIFYYSQTPLETPYLYELGKASITSGSNIFFENRSWLFAIDPLLGGSTRTCSDTFGSDCSLWPATSEGDNTFDTCPTSVGGASDEHVDEVSISSDIVYFGDTINVTCDFDPFSAGTEEYIYYYNTTNWIQLYSGSAPDGNVHSITQSIQVSNVSGTHYARCIIDWDGENDFCAETGQYYDNDDVSFTVISEFLDVALPQNISYATPLVPLDIFVSELSNITYKIDSGSFKSACSSCTSFEDTLFLSLGFHTIEVKAINLNTLEENIWTESFTVSSDEINPPIDPSQNTCTNSFGGIFCGLWPSTSEGDNTFDSCPSSLGGAGDENVQEAYVNSSLVYTGDQVEVTCTFDPFSTGTEEYIYYYNTTNWTQLYSGNGPDGNIHNISVNVSVSNVTGTHYFRCIADWDGEADFCADGGQYYDNDDVSLEVIEEVIIPFSLNTINPMSIEYVTSIVSFNATTSKNANISYQLNSESLIEVCSNCTLFSIDRVLRNDNYSLTIFAQDLETLEIINDTTFFSVNFIDPGLILNTSGRTCSDTFGFDCGLWPSASEGDNTFDSCSSSLGNAGDENVQQTSVNMSAVLFGTSVDITCTYDPFSDQTEEYIYYYNTTGWTQIYSGNAPDGNVHSITRSVTVDNISGTHYFRCIADWDGEADFCADGGQYYDNDDVSFEVIEPVVIPYLVSLVSPQNTTYLDTIFIIDTFATKNSNFSYQINGGPFISLCSNCTTSISNSTMVGGDYNFTLRAQDLETLETQVISREFTLISPLNITYSTFDGSTTDLSMVSDITNVCDIVLENSTAGRINFTQCINADNVDLDSNIFISNSFISLNSSEIPNYNTSAVITFYNINYREPIILLDEEVICSSCSIVDYNSSTLQVSVPHFSSYRVVENRSLEIFDYTDFFPVGINTQIGFFANYSFVNGSVIDDAICQVQYNTNGTFGSFLPMTYNNSIGVYDDYRTFPTAGIFDYNVSCSHVSFPTFNLNDTIDISPPSTLSISLQSPNTPLENLYTNIPLDVVFNVSCIGALTCSGIDITLVYEGLESIGESGSITLQNNERINIDFQKTYSQTPVVIMTPASDTNADNNALIPVIHSINTTSVEVSLCEDAGATTCSTSVESEVVHYMVFDIDIANTYSWIDVGRITNVPTSGVDTLLTFGNTFTNIPSVFAQAQTYSSVTNQIASSGWFDSITTTQTQIVGCDHPGTGNACAGSFSETYGYVAIDTTLHDITSLSAGTQSISNSDWTPVTFGQTYTSPIISVYQNSDTGAQDPQYPWAQNVGPTGADVRYCEQDGVGDCDTHSAEIIHWFTVEEGILYTSASAGSSVSSINGTYPLSVEINPQSFSVLAGESTLRNFTLSTIAPKDSLFTLFGITNYGPISDNFSVLVKESSLNITLLSPLNFQDVVQNQTFDVEVQLSCSGNCEDVDVLILNNGVGINNMTSGNPVYIIGDSQQQCTLGIDGFCLLTFNVNATGTIGSSFNISSQVNVPSLGSFVSNNSEITIVSGPQISFGTSEINFSQAIANYQDSSESIELLATVMDNTNVNIFCVSGNCSAFYSTFSNGDSVEVFNSTLSSFVCSPSSAGNYSAVFGITSNEDILGDLITMNCEATELPLFLVLENPDTEVQYDVIQNTTFQLDFNITCNDVIDCINVNLTLYYEQESIGEAGNINLENFETKSISFEREYTSIPIVIAVPASDTDSDNNALIPVITSISTTGFNIALCEDTGSSTCSSIVENELVHYMVFDQDIASTYSWIDVGSVSGVVTNGADNILTFGKTFSNTPYVFAQVQGDNDGGNTLAPSGWVDAITTTGAQLIGCDHPGTVDTCAGTTTETFGYVAIDFVSANISGVSSGVENIANSAWTTVSFSESYSNPIIAVYQNSDTGGQDPQYPWARSVTSTQADVRYCEQDGLGDCDGHSGENIVWFALEEGLILIGDKNSNIVDTSIISSPFYSDINPRYFNVSANTSSIISFLLNATGNFDQVYSVYGELGNLVDSKILDIRILGNNELLFSDSNLEFEDVFETEGTEFNSTILFSKYGNTNIDISCVSGNCSSFSTSWANGNSIVENQSIPIIFTCLDTIPGNLLAVFNVSSNEVSNADSITLSCNVLIKSLDIDLVNPLPLSTTQIIQNTSLNISVNVTCQDVLGCSNVNVSLLFDDLSKTWFNRSYSYRQNLSFIAPATTTENFVYLVELNSSNVGGNFNWNKNCNDLVFVYSETELDYYVDYCNFGAQIARIFVESDTPLIASQPYAFEMYYGNIDASSRSNGYETFLFFEDFEEYSGLADGVIPTGWTDLGNGDVRLTTEIDGNRALIKTGNDDSNGGFIDFGITLSNIEIYAKTNRINAVGGSANRYSITQNTGNGYGFYTANYGASTSYRIETRNTNTGSTLITGSNFATNQNAWYIQRFSYFNQNILFDFLDNSYTLLNSASGLDTTYSSFSRFNVHGGREFLTDDIFAREYVGSDPSINFNSEENIFSLIENSSTTPLYIIGDNPQLISLINGESIILEFLLNGTGTINTTYDIFGELSNGDRTQLTTIEIVEPQSFETNLSLQFESTYVSGNTYSSLLRVNNLLEEQTTIDKNITLHLYVPNEVTVSSFNVGTSMRYLVVQNSENLVDVYTTNGTLYEFELVSLLPNQGVFSAYTGSRTLDNSWEIRFNLSSNTSNNFFKSVLVGVE